MKLRQQGSSAKNYSHESITLHGSRSDLRFRFWNLAHPSCQPPVESILIALRIELDFLTNQLPFSCDETGKQLLQAALNNPVRGKEEVPVSLAAARETGLDAAVADVILK